MTVQTVACELPVFLTVSCDGLSRSASAWSCAICTRAAMDALGGGEQDGCLMNLGYLFNLRELYLFNNELSGELPESLVNLKNLRCLGASRNRLRGVSATRRLLEDEYGRKQNLQLEPQMSSVGAV